MRRRSPAVLDARTLLLDPVSSEAMVPVFTARVIAEEEAYAEKARAALTRRTPAVRDFYDLDYAVQTGRLQPDATSFVSLVQQKLTMPGNEAIVLNDTRRELLERQLEAELKPVLRPADFETFNFDRAYALAAALADRVK